MIFARLLRKPDKDRTMKTNLAITLICTLLAAPAFAQSTDEQQAIQAERQRLGNERIQLEAQRRALEEEQRLEEQRRLAQQQQAELQAQEATRASEEASVARPQSPPPPHRSEPDLSMTLDRLRVLGDLREAGHVTEEEFNILKKSILDDQN